MTALPIDSGPGPRGGRVNVGIDGSPGGLAAWLADEVIGMHAHVGDRLVVGTDRIGVVIGVPTEDGSPPYIVKWLKDGHIAMVSPDQYSRIIPAGDCDETGVIPQQTSTAGDRT